MATAVERHQVPVWTPNQDLRGTVYYLDDCSEAIRDSASVWSYQSPQAQARDLPTRKLDIGLVGWVIGPYTTVTVINGAEPGTVDRIEAAMADLGAAIAFDNREAIG